MDRDEPLAPSSDSPQIQLDVYETERDLVVLASVPGAAPEDVQATATATTLLLQVKIRGAGVESEATPWTWYLQEIPEGEFTRLIDLPVEVDPRWTRATFENGLLRLELPKAEAARPHRVPVQSGRQRPHEARTEPRRRDR
jgi:HSP20 family protein